MPYKKYSYLDSLRVFSIIMVILLHSICDYYANANNISKNLWFVTSYINELTRIGVPLFFMISGFLLLSKDIDNIKSFYKKRILKVGIPFIIYDVFYYIYLNYSLSNPVSVSGFLKDLINRGSAYHLWFVYSIIFIYLLIPFLRIIVKNCNMHQLLFLFVFSIFQTTIRPIINTFASDGFYLFLSDDGFSGYIGYVILGYILGTYDFNQKTRKIIYTISILSFLITPIITMKSVANSGNYLFIGGYCINHYLQAAGVFLFFKENLNYKNNKIEKLSTITFSAYLIHVFFLELLKHISFDLQPSLVMMIWFVGTTIMSFAWGYAVDIIKNKIILKSS